MQIALKDILERPDLESLTMQLHQLTGVSVSFYDSQGTPLLKPQTASMCNMFIEANEEAQNTCVKTVRDELMRKQDIHIGACPHGFNYAFIPIQGDAERFGAVFLHDFIIGEVSEAEHRARAERYGFDANAYIESVRNTPRISRTRALELARLFGNLGSLLSHLTHSQSRLEEMREAMQESIRFYSSVMQRNHAILLIIDPESEEVYDASLGAEEFYGYGLETLRGMPLSNIIVGEADELLSLLRDSEQRVSFHRMKHKRSKGDERDVDLQLTGMELANKPLILAIVQDVTKELAEEEKRRETEAKLVQAQKLEALGALASGIAHDFNNILSAMIGYAEFTKLQLDDSLHVQQHLSEILKAGDRAKDLVNQILTFSRQVNADPRPIDVAVVVKEVMKLLRITIPTTIEIRREIDRKAGRILADPTQIHQVLMNLCTNAFHAMHPGGGRMTVQLAGVTIPAILRESHPNLASHTDQFVRITVIDTGCGMDEETKNRIFDPFFTTKREGKGTGLGLATVYGIIEDMQGCIEVRSAVGEGTRFDIFLPKTESDSEELAEKSEALARSQGEHVLIIDDEESIITIGGLMLQRLGYRVTALQDPLEALEQFEADPESFDAVLTDFAMPGVNGFELADKMSALRPGMPIIMITGYNEEISDDFDTHGVTLIIHKPIDWKAISRTIQQFRYTP